MLLSSKFVFFSKLSTIMIEISFVRNKRVENHHFGLGLGSPPHYTCAA